MATKYEKLRISMRYRLLGLAAGTPSFFTAVKALEFAQQYHKGTRKDGKTPEFQHQLEIGHYLLTLRQSLMHPAETLAVSFLHDISEDYGLSHEELAAQFGTLVADETWSVTKKFRGTVKDRLEFFKGVGAAPIGSVLKGADRINNLGSMGGVFTPTKQLAYVQEAEDYFLPMLKVARRAFPQQEQVYENIKLMLMSQCTLVKAIHAGAAVSA